MSEYKGLLVDRIGGPGPDVLEEYPGIRTSREYYKIKVEAREAALFEHFNIDRQSRSAWRQLALALAKKHVPAFKGKVGRPNINDSENTLWLNLFLIVKVRDNSTDADAYRNVAKIVGKKPRLVAQRLKDLKKSRPAQWECTLHVFRVLRNEPQFSEDNEALKKTLDFYAGSKLVGG